MSRLPLQLKHSFLLLISIHLLTSVANAQTKYQAGKDYLEFERVRVMDTKGFDKPCEAFSLLLPKGWKQEGQIIWTPAGQPCDGLNMMFNSTSADGHYRFTIFPSLSWNWSADPMMQQMQANIPQGQFCNHAQPLQAEQYLRNAFIQELNRPQIISVKANEEVAKLLYAGVENNRQEIMSYGASQLNIYPSAVQANVKWQNGYEGILLCGAAISEITMPNKYNGTYMKIYSTKYSYRVAFQYPAGEKENAERMFTTILGSIRTNPWWKAETDKYWAAVRQQKQVVSMGKIRMMDEQTRQMGERAIAQGNARLKEMDRNTRTWENKPNSSSDKMHGSFLKTMREVENYQDETGKIELSSGYDHAWSRSDGSSFILTNSPNFDPSSVFQDQRWKEMKKVD